MSYEINPKTAEELIKHCKLLLGEPAIRVNITDDQCYARLKHSLDKYIKFAYDASERVLILHRITQQDIDNEYIITGNNILQVTSIISNRGKYSNNGSFLLPESPGTILTNPMFVVRQGSQFDSLRDPMMAYFTYKNYMANYRNALFTESDYEWNPLTKKLKIFTDWKRFSPLSYLAYTAYISNKPVDDSESDFWSNDWLIRYLSAQLLIQWGTNLGKFGNLTLPGGIQLKADEILSRGKEESKELLEELEKVWTTAIPIYTG